MEFMILAILLLVLAGTCLWREHVRAEKLRLLAIKMHASPMFAQLSPMLKNAQSRPIEQLWVDKTGVIVRYIYPAGSETRFILRDHGYAPLSEEKQRALLTLLEEFLPLIADSHRYALKKKRFLLINGRFETYYHYNIHHAYKATLMRAPQYQKPRHLTFPEW